MNKFEKQKNKGFTIVEAIIAIFILSISISAMLGLTVSSYSAAKYANNEITANYLLQEAIDSIRNSRDTIVFQQGSSWNVFLAKYGNSASLTGCFSGNGCTITISAVSFDPANPTVGVCNESGGNGIHCPIMQINGVDSRFKRQVKMSVIGLNEVEITATVEYQNGTSVKTRTLKMNLMNWQPD